MNKIYDVIIVGAGISGVSAAIYLKNANKKVLLIEKETVGGILNKVSFIKNYPGIVNITGPDLAFDLYKQIKENDIELLNKKVIDIKHEKGINIVKLTDEELECKYLILATGKEARKLNLDREDDLLGRGISYCALCDGPLYKNQDVAVIGSGNAALEEALYLANICHHVTIINKYDYFKGQESILKEVEEKENITIFYNSQTLSLNIKDEILNSIAYKKDGEELELEVSAAFIYIGSTPNIFSNLKLELENNFIKVDGNMETSIPSIYAVGDVIKKSLYQVVTAASDGSIAATDIIKKLNRK